MTLFPAGTLAGGVFFYVDKDGCYHFSDVQKNPAYVPVKGTLLPRSKTDTKSTRFDPIIRAAAMEYNVPFGLVKALIAEESGFNPDAVSADGACGLMQLMPVHVKNAEMKDPFDPKENIEVGTRFLSELLARYNGDLGMTIAAYNAGPAAVDRYQGIPPYKETRRFVNRVLARYYKYAGLISD